MMQRPQKKKSVSGSVRNAFTMVELLVIIASVSLLIALLLPAIQAVRESSRRSACQNNIKQTALALIEYESAKVELPTGARSQVMPVFMTGTHGVSWCVEILPYSEQTIVYERLDRDGLHSGLVLMHAENAQLANGVKIDSMLCPSSDIPTFWPVGSLELMMPSYVGIAGATSHDGFLETRVNTCCLPSSDGELSAGGTLIANESVKFKQVLDGLSNTMLLGEASDYITNEDGVRFRVDGGFPSGWITGTKGVGTPPTYGNPVVPVFNITSIRHPINTREYQLQGIRNNHGPNNPLVSAHSQGVNIAMGDASVRFFNEEIELLTLKRLATRDDMQQVSTAW